MSRVPAKAVRVLAAVGLGSVLVASSTLINLAAFIIWTILVVRWVKRQERARGRRAGATELLIQLATMSVIVLIAALAPCKVVDRVKAQHVTLPSQVMTIAELREPEKYEMSRSFHYWMSAPEDMAGRVVQFPSLDLTIGMFIAAIEAQTPLRHRFGHCGNGSTILWGGDCSFGLGFHVPPQ